MKIFFSSPEFDAQLLRALSYTYYGGADVGECMVTASRITEGDFDSWYNEWRTTADRVYAMGQESLEGGHIVSACEAFLRASNYYRVSTFFIYGAPVDQRLVDAYDLHASTFDKAIKLFSMPVEEVLIPFEEVHLPGYFYKVDNSHKVRPTIITHPGYDGTHQECYFTIAAAALRRGYHVLCIDGPGQGNLLIKQDIPMRPDWEKVITPVVDWLENRPEVDSYKLILEGQSWGGYLAPRAAAFEHRLAAIIANPGQFEALQGIKKSFPEIADHLEKGDTTGIGKLLTQAMSNKMLAQKFKSKMWVHHVDTAIDLVKEWMNYSLADVAANIQCSSLICDSENEPLSTGQAKQLYDVLQCPKEYILFTNAEGAGEHCEAGGSSLFHQKVFDWLDRVIHSPAGTASIA